MSCYCLLSDWYTKRSTVAARRASVEWRPLRMKSGPHLHKSDRVVSSESSSTHTNTEVSSSDDGDDDDEFDKIQKFISFQFNS